MIVECWADKIRDLLQLFFFFFRGDYNEHIWNNDVE